MKYTFTKIDEDTTELSYKDKKFNIVKDVDLMKRFQETNIKARTMMMVDLSKSGITKKELIIEKKVGSKTYYDNSNVLEIEKQYQELEANRLLDELCNKYFQTDLAGIITDIGITTEEDSKEFTATLIAKMLGNDDIIPSLLKAE